MKIAYFKDFKKEAKLEKTIQKLEDKDFSQVKKLSNSPYFRIKVDSKDRVIFQFLRYENETYILILEYVPNHDYQKSKFLRGKSPNEEDFVFPEKFEEAIFINEKKEFRYLDKFISFSESQENILNVNPPMILIGSAGSGKTSILIEKLRNLDGKVLYISLSKNLVENSKEICNCSENIEFLTFQELFNIRNEIDFEKFKEFANKHRITEVEKYFEEFRGVITGNFEKAFISENEYLELGKKESIFSNRDEIYPKFRKYLDFLKNQNLVDSNIEKLETFKNFDFIVIDEVQDFTNAQISAVLKNSQNFILSGDSNQIIYSNFFSWGKLKSMLFKTEENSQISILKENYRNSQKITEISNKLLKIKQLRFGSIDRESNYLIDTISQKSGEILFWSRGNIAKELNDKKRDDVNFAVIVFDEKSKSEARKVFQTPLIFTVQEAKGLEYRNIILFHIVSKNSKKFQGIVENIQKSDLEKELKYSRPKDKTDRELDEFKIYINSLYVAFTRGVENLYIVEQKEHRIWEILGVTESQKAIFERTSSTSENWEKESKRLERFGRTEQIEKIEKRQKERVSVEEHLENLRKDVFENGKDTKSNRIKLFKNAKAENRLKIIREMAEKLNFKNAKTYLDSFQKEDFDIAIQNGDTELLQKVIKSGYSLKGFNISEFAKSEADLEFLEILLDNGANADSKDEFRNSVLFLALDIKKLEIAKLLINKGANLDFQDKVSGATALIFASQKGHTEIVKLLIDKGANLDLQNVEFATALIIASQNGHTEIVKLLIEKGANLDLQNQEGVTALMFASKEGYTEIAKMLIEKGANLDLQDKVNGATALMFASQNGHTEIVKLLIDKGANLDLQIVEFATALIFASKMGHTEIAKLLIEKGANLDFQQKEGFTALIIASQIGHTEIAKLLIEKRANLDLQTNNSKSLKDFEKNKTALQIAKHLNHLEIIKLLQQAGAKE